MGKSCAVKFTFELGGKAELHALAILSNGGLKLICMINGLCTQGMISAHTEAFSVGLFGRKP